MANPIIPSGYFPTGKPGSANTPTGAPKAVATDHPYITKDYFLNSPEASSLNITVNSPVYTSGYLDQIILQASAYINRYCRRYFDTQTIDETMTGFTVRPFNPQLVTVPLQNAPYQHINAVYIEVLRWFIPIDITSSAAQLQDFWDYGYYKIVPLLSTAGSGVGSPLPAEILQRVPLGVLWTNYTFGFGYPLNGLTDFSNPSGDLKTYQAPYGYRLWAPSEPINVYVNGTKKVVGTDYNITDYANGIVVFTNALQNTDVVTADVTTNEAVPLDIKYATVLLVADYFGRGQQNPAGFNNVSMLGYSVTFSDNILARVNKILDPYVRHHITIL
jgi:hypothetical protein